jgi:hypothetical protein
MLTSGNRNIPPTYLGSFRLSRRSECFTGDVEERWVRVAAEIRRVHSESVVGNMDKEQLSFVNVRPPKYLPATYRSILDYMSSTIAVDTIVFRGIPRNN